MKQTFEKVIQKTNEFNVVIEDVLNLLRDTPKNFKLKKKVEAAYRSLKRSMEMHEGLITDVVPPINHKKTDYPADFIDTWNIYKDYLTEQFGIRMGSRMQLYRLKLLFEHTNKDFSIARRWLEFYMASGSANIFPVNEQKLEEINERKKEQKAGFIIPGK